MPVPATKGQLRTRIEYMQIGDYIICEYQANSGQVGVFRNLGTSTSPEIPVTGEAAPNGSFYFVMVDKVPGYGGLLVADRVIQHSISWNTLNAGMFIQGLPFYLDNVPLMTSNTTPRGEAFSNKNSSYTEWQAFDRNISTRFSSGFTPSVSNPAYLGYEFPTETIINGYTITPYGGQDNPLDFKFYGSNDRVNWTLLDTRTNVSWTESKQLFVLNQPAVYKSYKLECTRTGGGWFSLRELELVYVFGFGIVRSLTGGVAYADANGNSSTTDQGYSGWPANNEWDKYIVNFPADKIQAGKTLDDVFHVFENQNAPGTWCQDTPINGAVNSTGTSANSSYRTWRGRITEKRFNHSPSSFVGNQVGFRPVIEYKEV